MEYQFVEFVGNFIITIKIFPKSVVYWILLGANLPCTCHVIRLKADLSEAIPILNDKDEILDVIATFFNAGKTKNVAPLSVIQLDDPRFSSYSDVPPFDLKDFATTTALEQLRFVSISDYNFELKNIRIDLFETFAIVTFTVKQSGMIVDNYSFRGQHFTMESRASFVFMKYPKWKIVHIHLTKISD